MNRAKTPLRRRAAPLQYSIPDDVHRCRVLFPPGVLAGSGLFSSAAPVRFRCGTFAPWPRTRSQRLRTLAQIAVEVELRGPVKTPIFRVIPQEAAEMRERGLRVSAIARRFGVDHHTVDKALCCLRYR